MGCRRLSSTRLRWTAAGAAGPCVGAAGAGWPQPQPAARSPMRAARVAARCFTSLPQPRTFAHPLTGPAPALCALSPLAQRAGDQQRVPRDRGPGVWRRPHGEADAQGGPQLPQVPREAQQLAQGAAPRRAVLGMLRWARWARRAGCWVLRLPLRVARVCPWVLAALGRPAPLVCSHPRLPALSASQPAPSPPS